MHIQINEIYLLLLLRGLGAKLAALSWQAALLVGLVLELDVDGILVKHGLGSLVDLDGGLCLLRGLASGIQRR